MELFIFGSTARHTRTASSDIDILVQYKSLDVYDINNSIFLNSHLTNIIAQKLTIFSGFELQIVGPYELRFFDYKRIFSEMINLTNFDMRLLNATQ
jgi:predicted nucleotidyltransferase